MESYRILVGWETELRHPEGIMLYVHRFVSLYHYLVSLLRLMEPSRDHC